MRRVLSRIGVGAATVDTLLPKTEFVPGETVEATVEVTGGDSEQTIDQFYFALVATDEDGTTHPLGSFEVLEGFVIEPGETRSVPVEFEIPPWTPVTRDGVSVRIDTGLDIDWAVDPTDTDGIDVVPGPYVEALFEAVEDLGFAYRGTAIEPADLEDDRPVVQDFAFRPREEPYASALDGLVVTTIPQDDHLRVVAAIDRVDEIADAEGFDLDFDEQQIPMKLRRASADRMQGRLKNELDEQVRASD